MKTKIATLVYRAVRWYFGDTPPYEVIRVPEQPTDYMHRWWLFPRNRFFNIYVHRFLRSDDDRAFHDHPWWNVSYILQGVYFEHMPTGVAVRLPGDIVYRPAELRHRIELVEGDDAGLPYVMPGGEVWSLFVRGKKSREWGFWCPQGWKHWRDFGRDDGC